MSTILHGRVFKEFKGIGIAFIALLTFFGVLSPHFLTLRNLISVFLQVSIISITAFGMTYVLMIGGIDLSVGSIIALSGMIFALVLNLGEPLPLAIGVTLMVGLLAGFLNGGIITKLEIPPFVVTLATMGIFRGIAYALTDSKPVPIALPQALAIGNTRLLFIPIPIWIVLFCLILAHINLDKTRQGRQVKLLGGNREAAKYAGIKVGKVQIFVFMISGIASAVSGIILTSRLYSAQPNAAIGYELDAIAAAVLGGTSLTGGYGSVLGTSMGALIIGVINNGMNLLGLPYFYQLIIKGIIIIIAVYADIRNKKKLLHGQ